MGEGPNQTYRNREGLSAYVGDPFSEVPVDRDIVDQVATDFELAEEDLARALRDIERSQQLLSVEVFYSGFDPVPLGTDENGHLFLKADASNYWNVVAQHLNLTSLGRDAVAAAHDRHVNKFGSAVRDRSGTGFIVTCPEFPETIVEDIQTIIDRTTLSARQATVWRLSQHALSTAAIANILSIPEGTVKSEMVKVDEETRRVNVAAKTLDLPSDELTWRKPDPTSNEWMGIDWSPWFDLQNRETLLEKLPEDPGLYRVCHSEVRGLLYVGETGSSGGLRDRVGHGLAAGLGGATRPSGGNHDATVPLWKIASAIDGRLKVSVATPPIAANRRHRLGLEAALVATCRRETGRTPSVMLNRDPLLDSTSRIERNIADRSFPLRDESYVVPTWRDWRSVTSPEWLGFDWTSSRPLAERSTVDNSGTCAFRVWQQQETDTKWDRTLITVGTTESLHSRLFTLHNEYGGEAMFSVTELHNLNPNDIVKSRELQEVRYDLVGAHYLAAGKPPRDQF